MTISRALANATSGLSVAQRRADITSNNIANATTPGYARRDLVVNERVLEGKGAGVQVGSIQRAEDAALTSERRQSDAASGRAEIIAQGYGALNQALGLPGDEFGLFSTYQNLETSLRDFSVTPESSTLQSNVLNAATEVTRSLNQYAELGENLRVSADGSISNAVDTINESLQRIENLNRDIARSDQNTGQIAAYLDERQQLIDTVGEYIPVRELQRDNGQVDIITNEGVFLLSGKARELTFNASGVAPSQATYAGGQLSGLFVEGQEITPTANVTSSVQGGKISGYFAIRDQIAPQFTTQLDSLAGDLIQRFTDTGIDPTIAVGQPGLFTDNGAIYDAANVSGLASRVGVNAAIDPAQGGDTYRLRDGVGAVAPGAAGARDIPEALLNAFTDKQAAPSGSGLSGVVSVVEGAAGILSSVGQARVRADGISAATQARTGILRDAELANSAVDTDQELQSLLLIEQAYAANARVIQTVSAMMDRLLEL